MKSSTLLPISTNPIIILTNKSLQSGQIVAAYGKRYLVELANQQTIDCVTRGKKNDCACGDQVSIALTSSDSGVIEAIQTRKTLLFRSNAFRTKVLAANVSQIIIVLATSPSFYESLLNRCLIAARHEDIRALIVLNKADLPELNDTLARLSLYQQLGYQVLPICAREDVSPLLPYLQGQTSLLVGQSGMGKSTIINGLFPKLQIRTREISNVLDSGKHTTTATHLYHLNEQSDIIDSPGLQEFGLHHLSVEDLEMALQEFRPYLGQCRFNNCKHIHEPDCAILKAYTQGHISKIRLDIFHELLAELDSH